MNNYVKLEARNHRWFQTCDINDVYDDRLYAQNKKYGIALNLGQDTFSPTMEPTNDPTFEPTMKPTKKKQK